MKIEEERRKERRERRQKRVSENDKRYFVYVLCMCVYIYISARRYGYCHGRQTG